MYVSTKVKKILYFMGKCDPLRAPVLCSHFFSASLFSDIFISVIEEFEHMFFWLVENC